MFTYSLIKQKTFRMNLNPLRRNMATHDRFYDPMNDVAFIKLFGDKEQKPLLLSFLNSILRRKDDNMIDYVELLPLKIVNQLKDFKYPILNVSCFDKKGRNFNVEMQTKKISPYIQKLKHYASCKKHLFYNSDNLEINPLILLTIANCNIFPKKDQYISYHCNYGEETNNCFLPDISYVFVELPKFNKSQHEIKTLDDYWVFFFKKASSEKMILFDAPHVIRDAHLILEKSSWNVIERINYEKMKISIFDYEEIIQNTINESEDRVREEIAYKLLKKGLDIQNISDYTGLPISKVNELVYQF
jgi:predicted transposase/invertase (TIGR01784 family)